MYLHCFKMMAFGTQKANISIENLSNEKTTDCLGYIGDFTTHYVGNILNHYKDPY